MEACLSLEESDNLSTTFTARLTSTPLLLIDYWYARLPGPMRASAIGPPWEALVAYEKAQLSRAEPLITRVRQDRMTGGSDTSRKGFRTGGLLAGLGGGGDRSPRGRA